MKISFKLYKQLHNQKINLRINDRDFNNIIKHIKTVTIIHEHGEKLDYIEIRKHKYATRWKTLYHIDNGQTLSDYTTIPITKG